MRGLADFLYNFHEEDCWVNTLNLFFPGMEKEIFLDIEMSEEEIITYRVIKFITAK